MRTILIIGLALVLVGCGSGFSDRNLDETTFDATALAMVQKGTGIRLPSGSRGLKMFYDGTSSIDPSFVAKIRIPDSSGDELANRLEQIRNQDGTVSGSLAEKVAWWTPTNGTIRVQRQFHTDGNYIRAILSQEKDGLAFYLEWIKI